MEVRCCYHCQSWAHLRIDSAETENAVFFLRVPPTNHASHAVHQCCTPTMTALACPRARFGGSVEVPAGRHGARVSWTIRRARAGLSSLPTLAGHLESLHLESQRRRKSWGGRRDVRDCRPGQ